MVYVPTLLVSTLPLTLTLLVISPSHLSVAEYPASLYLLPLIKVSFVLPFKVIVGSPS